MPLPPHEAGLPPRRPGAAADYQVCHYMTRPLVELYGGCMVALKVSRCGINLVADLANALAGRLLPRLPHPRHARGRP